MIARLLNISLVILLAGLLVAYDVPKGWIVAGSKPDWYEMGTDPGAGHNGKNAATIRSIRKEVNGFGTLMQNFAADKYKGKRIKLTGYVKSKDVDSWCGLWLRIDGAKERLPNGKEKTRMLSFDNMYNRSIKGTVDYTKCEIVLDVPDSAVSIAYGALLHGAGQIWFDRLKFDVVSKDVPTTDYKLQDATNLDFTE